VLRISVKNHEFQSGIRLNHGPYMSDKGQGWIFPPSCSVDTEFEISLISVGSFGGTGEECIMRSFVTCTLHQILLGEQIKEYEMGAACSAHGRDDKCVQNIGRETWMKETTQNRHLDRRIILDWILSIYGVKLWTGFIWLRIGTSGGHLWTR
jgi:hypothetical protein